MAAVVRDTSEMVRQMAPVLKPGRFAFRTVTTAPGNAVATFVEDEGLSVLVPAEAGETAFCQITLQVHSALDGVGLTAAVATALTDENIPANVVAAHHHDHVFVPETMAARALSTLKSLAAREG
ncbi:MAG: ACT domain-containing protein [Pseudomonadota bacterium]